jgi:23S rRNA pseudouridine955/2504/2580 synthase
VRYVRVRAAAAGQRVDNFLLRELKGVPRSHVYRLLRTGQVRVNGGRAKPHRKLREGEELRVPPWTGPAQAAALPPSDALKAQVAAAVFYEDTRLIALNKPAGLAVHGGTQIGHGVIEVLRAMRPDAPFLELAHRLDRATSGCLLVAKDRKTLTHLHDALREGRVEKRYLALLCGEWRGSGRRVDLPLGRGQRDGERVMRVDAAGKPSVTCFRPRHVYSGFVLADVDMETGRTHQIRVHAASIGHPVAGDLKYGDREKNRHLRAMGLRRLFLHAARFQVAFEDAELSLQAPPGPELLTVLKQLRR